MQKKKFKAYLFARNSIQSYEKWPKFSTEKLDADDRQYSPQMFRIGYSVALSSAEVIYIYFCIFYLITKYFLSILYQVSQ